MEPSESNYEQIIGGQVITFNPDTVFKSIEDEMYRIYKFPNETSVHIAAPVALHVSGSGGHRVVDAFGISHYIPSGWVHLMWENKEGAVRCNF